MKNKTSASPPPGYSTYLEEGVSPHTASADYHTGLEGPLVVGLVTGREGGGEMGWVSKDDIAEVVGKGWNQSWAPAPS